MLMFQNDYSEIAHETILRRLMETNYEKVSGYGTDAYCESAKEKIRAAIDCPEAEVFFLVGGTQTNQIVIDTMLQSYEGVVAAQSGHISVHEAGAIEFSGHKVLALPQHEGKLDAAEAERFIADFYADGNHEHMVYPGMVYVSHPTECGTLYTKEELTAISGLCRRYEIPLYLDGARMGYALAAESDLSLADIARLCDAFYIGGTKVGALCGEAVVFAPGKMPAHFVTRVKQRGALLAKGRVLGVQFDTLFTDGLYERISRNAITAANRIRAALREKGYRQLFENPTNQIFVILSNEQCAALEEKVALSFWEKYDEDHTVLRICTSWATREEDVDALIALL